MIHPLFKWFGSKWMSAKHLPSPEHDTIIEPFAGGAGYSLRHHEKKVYLAERDTHLYNLWTWLIEYATESLIREIPINVPEGTDVRTLGLDTGQALLLKSWQRTISPWGNKPGQWTANTRARVSEEVSAIKHWEFCSADGFSMFGTTWDHEKVTWFIDPPYEFNYQYRAKEPFDHTRLQGNIWQLEGQVIACEARCPKSNKTPKYLPFHDIGERVTSRRKEGDHHHSKELLFHKKSRWAV